MTDNDRKRVVEISRQHYGTAGAEEGGSEHYQPGACSEPRICDLLSIIHRLRQDLERRVVTAASVEQLADAIRASSTVEQGRNVTRSALSALGFEIQDHADTAEEVSAEKTVSVRHEYD